MPINRMWAGVAMETKRNIAGCIAAVAVVLCLSGTAMASAVGDADTLGLLKLHVEAEGGLIAFRPVGSVVRIGTPAANHLPDFRSWLPVPLVRSVVLDTKSTVKFVRLLPP